MFDTCSVDPIEIGADGLDGPGRFAPRLAVFLVIVCVVGLFESRYVLWGEVVSAKVISARQIAAGTQMNVEFEFQDESGQVCREQEDVIRDGSFVPGGTIQIEYIRGNPHSARLAGTGRPFAAWVLFGAILSLLVALGLLWRHAHKALYTPRRRRFRFKQSVGR